MKTTIAQIVAERFKMEIDNVSVSMGVDTQLSPKHWKTVASMTTLMAGNAAIKASDDLIHQLKALGAIVLKCTPQKIWILQNKKYIQKVILIYMFNLKT